MNTFRAWFVTGTDTGVGKTLVTCALLRAAQTQGLIALGMKPIAAGTEIRDGRAINEDAARLLVAGSFDPGLERLNPYCLHAPLAPHLAARKENVLIKLAPIHQAFDELRQQCDRLFIEGAGGFLAPLGEGLDASNIAQDLDLPLILVVGMRLGCINHAVLTAEAIAARGLRLEGWIANSAQTDMPYLAENIDTLLHRIDAPLLGTLPYAPAASLDVLAQLITLPA